MTNALEGCWLAAGCVCAVTQAAVSRTAATAGTIRRTGPVGCLYWRIAVDQGLCTSPRPRVITDRGSATAVLDLLRGVGLAGTAGALVNCQERRDPRPAPRGLSAPPTTSRSSRPHRSARDRTPSQSGGYAPCAPNTPTTSSSPANGTYTPSSASTPSTATPAAPTAACSCEPPTTNPMQSHCPPRQFGAVEYSADCSTSTTPLQARLFGRNQKRPDQRPDRSFDTLHGQRTIVGNPGSGTADPQHPYAPGDEERQRQASRAPRSPPGPGWPSKTSPGPPIDHNPIRALGRI